MSVQNYDFRTLIGWFNDDVIVVGELGKGPALGPRQIVRGIGRGPVNLQGPSVCSNQLLRPAVQLGRVWFPVGRVGK